MNDDIEISVICAAYNHEDYIASALEGFLSQVTDSDIEIIVNDDASTDGTALIIKEYQEKSGGRIRGIYQTENQHSQGVNVFKDILIPETRGKYIAICEGDDYWTDPLKLQKQRDAMELHPEIDLCAHAFDIRDARSGDLVSHEMLSSVEKVIAAGEVILGEGGFFGTNTLMVRSSALSPMPNFARQKFYDYSLQILGSLRGGVLYLPELMSVYRTAVPGSFCSTIKNDPDAMKSYIDSKKAMLSQLDDDTGRQYHREIEARILLYEIDADKSSKENRAILRSHREGYSVLHTKDKVAVAAKCLFPWVVRIKREIASKRNEKN